VYEPVKSKKQFLFFKVLHQFMANYSLWQKTQSIQSDYVNYKSSDLIGRDLDKPVMAQIVCPSTIVFNIVPSLRTPTDKTKKLP
jgi:hypothetical protein